jgi:hypothetical protein
MTPGWGRDLFALPRGPVPLVLWFRVAFVTGLPLIGLTTAGLPVPGVVAATTGLLVTLADVGVTRGGRVGSMLLALATLTAGGAIGNHFGSAAPWLAEALVLASALVAGWVVKSQPAIAVAARFGAVATAVGAGTLPADARLLLPMAGGGALALAAAHASWLALGQIPDQNYMDWRHGLHRALAGTGAGPRYALAYGAMTALALLAAGHLGVTRPYWAALTVVLVMRPEGTESLRLLMQYSLGTLIGVALAAATAPHVEDPVALAVIATLAAASARLGLAVQPLLGFTAMNLYFMIAIDTALRLTGGAPHLLGSRLYDVLVGCLFALAGTLLASRGQHAPGAASPG